MMLRLPGVYEPETDTHLLLRAALAENLPASASVLDVGTGTGRIALGMAAAGAADVTAIDISRRAVWAARLNSRLHGLPIRAHRGDLLGAVAGRRFDLILANPPYAPCGTGLPGRHSRTRAWDAGLDGRELLDRICLSSPAHLKAGGVVLLVHSGLCGVERTVDLLESVGLDAEIIAKVVIPFGPVLNGRAEWLETRGLIAPGVRIEELVVVRGRRS